VEGCGNGWRDLRGTMGSMSTTSQAARVDRLVPYVHVADVEASLAFYAMLGFAAVNVMRDDAGRAFWALAATQKGASGRGPGEIMFAQANPEVDPAVQAVLLYMYCDDVATLRAELLAKGLYDGGVYYGGAAPNGGRGVVHALTRPAYMPGGEFRMCDPDGYVILMGQLPAGHER